MRFIAVTSFLLIFVQPASATSQIWDTLIFGEHEYGIPEKPMAGVWQFGGGVPEPGRQKVPDFESRSTANHVGYEARFEIRDSKLMLRKLSGWIAGKERRNEEILPEMKFPVIATWFTGKIHLCVGDFDFDGHTADCAAVIIFQVEKGTVKKMEFAERMQFGWSWPWNGVPRSETTSRNSPQPLMQSAPGNQTAAIKSSSSKLNESGTKN
jgi:hypothetical protein